ncbi:hypothetical protein C0Q70_19453 [Pomacea canaliculata]|uniref:Uncharacterized protein n=1 Tax=Pomacea canaliculata TaxID=400727 RepID=A0A2T7NJD3_POMCA|nr:hypothetical protein C0Q70_19453 [Pomacea canaliculata]
MTQDDEDDGDLHPAALYSGGSSSHQHHHHYHNHHRPFSSHARQSENQRQGNGLQVRTIITDSNGHSSRYENPVDSRGQLHRRGSSGYGTSATSVGGGCGGGASSGGGSGGGYSTAGSSSGSRRDSTKMSSSASSGGVGSGGSPINTGGKSSGKNERRPSKDRRLSSTSSDQSNQSLKAHEAPLLEVAGLSLKPGSGPSLHSRAASFKEQKPSNELHVDEAALIQARRNSMPTVTNNLLAVPTGGGGGEGGEPKETRLRRVRSFKTTSKGVVVNRGDSFKKKSTHSLMSTGSEIKDGDRNSRARSSSNNNSALDLGSSSPTSPSYFRVNMMGAASVGKTSLAQQFLTSEYIGHDDNGE